MKEFITVTTLTGSELVINTDEVMCLLCEKEKCNLYLINSNYAISYKEYERLKKLFVK